MSNIVIRKNRSTTTALSPNVLTQGDLWIDITKSTVVVGDGSTSGGVPLALEVHTHADATEGTDGFMSATDKTKLDALSVNGGIQNVLTNGTPVTQSNTMNFSANFGVVYAGSNINVDLSSSFTNTMMDDIVAYVLALS